VVEVGGRGRGGEWERFVMEKVLGPEPRAPWMEVPKGWSFEATRERRMVVAIRPSFPYWQGDAVLLK